MAEKAYTPRKRFGDRATAWLYPALTFFDAIVLWQLVVVATDIHAIVLPAPTTEVARMYSAVSVLAENTMPTVIAIVVGFLGALAVGLPLAILIAASSTFEKSCYPLLLGSQ